MRTLALLVAAGALAVGTQANAVSIPPGGLNPALAETDIVDQAAVYVYEGRRFCFYFDGWNGPGWYRCGFAFRRGLGWGGTYGWRSWRFGPAERRFGRFDRGRDFGSERTVRGRDYRGGRDFRGERTMRGDRRMGADRGPGRAMRGGATVRGGTTGSGVRDGGQMGGGSRGGATIQRGGGGGGTMGGGGGGARGGGGGGGAATQGGGGGGGGGPGGGTMQR
jgi:hypothetical protein